MAIVTETIRVVVTGANPQTLTFSVPVDTSTGAGVNPLSIPLPGTNAGTDTITAFMDSHSLTSNASTVVWQPTNSPIAVGPVTIDVWNNNAQVKGWTGSFLSGAGSFSRTFPFLNNAPGANSLILNQVFINYPISGFNNQPTNNGPGGGYKLCPTVVVQQTATGTYSSSLAIPGTSDGDGGNADNGSGHGGFLLSVYGSIVVKTAGTYTIYGNQANSASMALWIPGTTVSSSNGTNVAAAGGGAFPATSPKFGYSPLTVVNTNASEAASIASAYVTFPKAGVYSFEAVMNQFTEQQFGGDVNCYFEITYLSGTQNQSVGSGSGNRGVQFFPIAISTAPPTGATPTGSLRLTPVGGTVNLVTQAAGTTLTLTVQNVVYANIPYVPIWEGTAGSMFITNSGSNFVFQTYNGNPVNTPAAASQVFAITANNSAIAGLFTVSSTGVAPAPFLFNYNGGAFTFAVPGSQIASSNLTITADDIAWFDLASGKFDLFNGGSGSTAFSVDVDYMTKPSVASVSPTSVTANGSAQALQINLNKPMSPQQQGLYGTGNTVTATASASGGATVGILTPILDSAGFLQGWSTTITPPTSSTNGTITLSMSVTGTLTYLSGTNFVTTAVTYITGAVATINTLGGFVPPVGVSLTTVPASTTLQSASAPTNTPQPIRRATWGGAIGADLSGAAIAGNIITIYGEGRGTVFPSTLVTGAQVTLAGFLVPFPNGSGITGQGGSSQSGASTIPATLNLNGTYTVTNVTTAVVGGSEVCPVFTVTAPSVAGPCRSYDWGSTQNPPDSGWTFTAPASSAGVTTIIGTEYTYDNPSSCTVQFFKVNINPASAAVNIGSPTSTPTSAITTTVGGKTVFQKVYQINYTFPIVTVSAATGAQINLGFVVTDNTTGLKTTYQSTTTYIEPYTIVVPPVGGGGGGTGCFTDNVMIETPDGFVEFGALPTEGTFKIKNLNGVFDAHLIIHENYSDDFVDYGNGQFVTTLHEFKSGDRWITADEYYSNRYARVHLENITVYNMHVHSDNPEDFHYVLENGDVAHNITLAKTL